ncbi:LuxR C-terminal-related transcriptional regulator [Streptomyces sp. NPDC058335]|uniref:LuxR C-terminal-related transcriptional regulator n=1 Tax=Streptomyces sp. NPDC058335 TaxID=3346451 RepID=UPI003652C381
MTETGRSSSSTRAGTCSSPGVPTSIRPTSGASSPPTRAPHGSGHRPRVRRLRLVAAGHANPDIGTELNLSASIVSSCLREMMHELAARNRAQLTAKARTYGLL